MMDLIVVLLVVVILSLALFSFGFKVFLGFLAMIFTIFVAASSC